MKAVYLRELRSYFTTVIGYLFIAAMTLLTENINDAVRRPLSRVPKIGLAISFNELIGDLLS